MQVSVETTGAVERRMTIEVPKEDIVPKIQSQLKSMARKTKVDGFRPGKVPVRVIEQKYGNKVRQEVLGEILKTSFSEALTQEKLSLVGDPIFDLNNDIKELDEGLSYTVTFEIYPEITTLEVDGLAIEKQITEISETDVDTMLYRLRQQRQTWKDVDERIATQGDRIVFDFVGTINGSSFKGNEVKQASLILGKNDFTLPGFEEKLEGVKTGEEREFDLTFPDEHSNKEIAGQTVHFVVNVSKVSIVYLPEIEAEFVKSFGVPDGRVETLRVETRNNMERELKYVTDVKIKQQILEALLKANPIEVPPSLIEQETQQLLKSRQQEWKNQNLQAEAFKDEAQDRVKLGFLIGELVNKHNFKVQAEEVRQMVERIAFAYDDPDAVIRQYYADEQRLKEVESIVLENQIVAWLLDRAEITEKQTDFYTIVMGENQTATGQVANK
jgi:trigger factor